MIVFPNAKINLGLNVLKQRTDGFHNIETILYPVGLSDILEIVPSGDKKMSYTSTGLIIPGNINDNLCVRAFRLLSSTFRLPPVKIHLHKVIPMGAGLGGGSSDGAFTIKVLNDLFSLKLSDDEMMDFARKLGSDCAFFIKNEPLFAYGLGDRFKKLSLDLSRFTIRIVSPDIHVNTSEAYRMIDNDPGITGTSIHLMEIIKKPVSEWNQFLINDFEKVVFKAKPGIRMIKEKLYEEGAVYASMTGSGSSVYGIFTDPLIL
jgi:4-diphosphocytidyl-2-C-methyl-D-erythritol kinase